MINPVYADRTITPTLTRATQHEIITFFMKNPEEMN